MSDKKHDYIPRGNTEFDGFMSHIVHYVRGKVVSEPPAVAEWPSVPLERFNSLENKYNAFKSAFVQAFSVPTPANNRLKYEAKEAATAELRQFVNQFLRFEPVTNTDRAEMGIPNRDTVNTSHNVVDEMVEFVLHIRGIREIIIEFWVLGHATKAKPRNYAGVVIKYGICSEPPKSIDELHQHTIATKTPFTVYFKETERGKTVYFVLAWQNKRGILGHWSEIQSAIIP